MVEIIKVKWGVSNYYSNPERIEVNEKLYESEFDDLRNRVITHELEHHRANKFKKKSFWKQREIDMKTELKFKDLLPIYKKYPKLFFQQNCPINYSKEKDTLFIEWSRIFLIIFYAGILFLIYYLISLFSTNSIFFWKVIKYLVLILGIYFGLSFIGKKLIKSINEDYKNPKKKSKE